MTPSIFTIFANVLRDIIVIKLTSTSLLHYLDGYLLISSLHKEEEAKADFKKSKAVCNYLGVPWNEPKSFPPATIMVFSGIELDTMKLEARLPHSKLDDLIILLNKWLTKGFGKERDLDPLMGNFNGLQKWFNQEDLS